jgi:hypothetical protein
MSQENAERQPGQQAGRGDIVEKRSVSSLLFQSLDAVGDVGLGTGTLLAGAAAWKKVTGSEPPEQQPPPPAEPPANK